MAEKNSLKYSQGKRFWFFRQLHQQNLAWLLLRSMLVSEKWATLHSACAWLTSLISLELLKYLLGHILCSFPQLSYATNVFLKKLRMPNIFENEQLTAASFKSIRW